MVFQGAWLEGPETRSPGGRGGRGKQNQELEGEGCGWAQIQPASPFPSPANPLALAGALEAGAWNMAPSGGWGAELSPSEEG